MISFRKKEPVGAENRSLGGETIANQYHYYRSANSGTAQA